MAKSKNHTNANQSKFSFFHPIRYPIRYHQPKVLYGCNSDVWG